jgi:hypothetical protein
MTTEDAHDGHVSLTSDEPNGRAVRETVPARFLAAGLIEILGSPALVVGCAAGDVIRVSEDGRFETVHRGPNVSVQAVATPAFTPDDVQRLSDALREVGGIVEAPPDRRFLVATIPTSAGEQAINAILDEWTAPLTDFYWQYGVVDRL